MPLIDRFWAKVNKTDTCWLWTGGSNSRGYGQIFVNPRLKYAHRVSFEMHCEPIPPGLLVLHKCDVRLCVRPDHLFIGTPMDNTLDMVSKGRHVKGGTYSGENSRWERGETHHNAKLSNIQVAEIRRRCASGEKQATLAQEFGVNHQTISKINTRRLHRSLKEAAD